MKSASSIDPTIGCPDCRGWQAEATGKDPDRQSFGNTGRTTGSRTETKGLQAFIRGLGFPNGPKRLANVQC